MGGPGGSFPAGNLGSDPQMPDIGNMMKMFGSMAGDENGKGAEVDDKQI
jgi:hypothetical protein